MKRNIYSKLWMIFFVLMGAACTNQVEDAIPVSGQPIGFSVQSDWKEIPNTRSNDKTQFVKDDVIQIFGFHKPYSGAAEKDQKLFMYQEGDQSTGQKVVYNGKDWNYSPKRFWPKKGTIDFFASYPYNSVHYTGVNQRMTYDNPLTQDLLYGLATDRPCASNDIVRIWMVHALAKVKISFNGFWGDIQKVKVSAYKAGYFEYTIDGVPHWIADEKKGFLEVTFSPDKGQTKIDDVTVFILAEKINGLILTLSDGREIDASKKIQEKTFLAGKVYNLTISNGVRKKNTNSRSIAMSVRCVSE